MAEDFLLNGPENKPNPGPTPFSYQNIFDAFKSKDTKSLRVYDDTIKNLREIKTPEELAGVLSNKQSALNFFSQNRNKLQNFAVFNLDDFTKRIGGESTDFDKIQIASTASNLRKTNVPDFGKPGFDSYWKNRQNLQAMDESAIGAFSEVAIAGLNVKHTGEEIQDYNQMREYFSNPDNYDKWQKQKFVQDGLNKNKLSAFSILERLQPKETPATAIAEAEVQNAIPQDQFLGKIDEAQIGKILDEGGDIPFDENSGIYRDIEEDDFVVRNAEAMLSSGQGLGINEVNFVTKKEEKLNKESLNKYLTSLGMTPEEIEAYKLDKIEKYRHQKFLNIDLQRNMSSAEGVPIDIFKLDQGTTPFGNKQAMYYAFGSKNAYQQAMDSKGYNMLSEQDQKIHAKLLELDKHRRELSFYENADPADYTSAKQKYDKVYSDFKALTKDMGLSGFDIYDPETRQPFPQQIVAGVSEQVSQKYNDEYYAKTPLGKMKRERNALFSDTEALSNEIRTIDPNSEEYILKKKLYLQKSVELHTLNRALYTNDNPMKRMGNGGAQFIDGVKEAMNPDQNISRLDETLAVYNNLSRYGLVLDEKDIEEVEKNLQPTMMETFGEGLYTTSAILVETALYSYIGMGALGAATRLKQYTRLKEGYRALYGKDGVALINVFEKLAEFSIKGGSQLLTGQTTAGFVTEEVFEEGADKIAKTFKRLYSNKVSAFFTKFTAGTIGSSIGEFFGNMADALLENGFDVREAFKETYGEDWETQEKQLAVIGFMSMGFSGASNIGLLIKTKQQFQYWKQQLGGEFKDELTITAERMIDEAIANYKTGTTTNQRQVDNIQAEDPSALPITDPVVMSSDPIEAPQAGVSEQTESRVLEPIEEQKATELKQEEKLEVENRVAERGEVFYVVEADGTVNKDVEYRYNEESGKIESRGYTAFNNKFEEVNDDLARTVEAKVNDSGMLSKTKAEELASTKLGLDKSDRLVEIDGQVFLSRDPQAIRQEIDRKVDNVNTVAKNRFSNKVSELRNKIKDSLFGDAETQFTPEFNDFFTKLKTSLNMRMNRTNILFKGAAYMVESSYKGLPKVADYLGSINLSFSKTKAGLDLLTEFTDKILLSKRFKDSDLSKDANATDYATNIALQMLLNEDPTVAAYFDGDKDAINAFNRFRTGFVRHAAKNFTGGTVKYNASFFNQNVNPNVEKRTEQDLDRTEQDQIMVREQRRGIKRIFDMAGEGERLDLTKEENLKTVDAIRYANGDLSAADFLTSIGENVEGKTDQEITTLADTKRDEFADISKFEGWSQRLIEFSKNEKAVKKKLRKELNTNFSYVHPEFQEQVRANTLVGRARKEIAQGVRRAVNLNVTNRRKNRQSAEIMYEMLQTMALRSDRTPEQVLDETIAFQKANKEQAEQIIAQAYNSPDLNVLFDFYIGEAGASYANEMRINMSKGRDLLDRGEDPKKVQLMYGVVRGRDGQMRLKLTPQFRFENPQTLTKIYNGESIGSVVELGSIIDHPVLFDIYPDLRKLKLEFSDFDDPKTTGSFTLNSDYMNQRNMMVSDEMTADQNIFDIGASPGVIRIKKGLSATQLVNTLKHEIQHAVQNLEGVDSGSSETLATRYGFTKIEGESLMLRYFESRAIDEVKEMTGTFSEEQLLFLREITELPNFILSTINEIQFLVGIDTTYRGAMFFLGNLVKKAKAASFENNNLVDGVILDIIRPLNPSLDADLNVIVENVKDIINGPGNIKYLEFVKFINTASSYDLYFNTLGEIEARAAAGFDRTVNSLYQEIKNFVSSAVSKEDTENKAFIEYKMKAVTQTRDAYVSQLVRDIEPYLPTADRTEFEKISAIEDFLFSREAYELRNNEDFLSAVTSLEELHQNMTNAYVSLLNTMRDSGLNFVSKQDQTFADSISNSFLTKLLDAEGVLKEELFYGDLNVDESTKRVMLDELNERLDTQARLEEELFDTPFPMFDKKGKLLPPETKGERTIRVAETKLFKVLEKKFKELYPEISVKFFDEFDARKWAEADNNIYNQLSKKKKEEYKKSLERLRPDLVEQGLVESVLDEIEKFGEENSQNGMGNPKLEKLAMYWIAKGNVTLPEDGYKIVEANRISTIKKIDPFTFNDPVVLINTFLDEVKEKPIDPDTIVEFKDKQEFPEQGVVIYTVDDTREGMNSVRKIIDTHFNKDANPWCVARRDPETGSMNQAWDYWSDRYNAYPKQIAFKNGKLVALSANRTTTETWWDRSNASAPGIEVEMGFDTSGIKSVDPKIGDLSNIKLNALLGKDGLIPNANNNNLTKTTVTNQGKNVKTIRKVDDSLVLEREENFKGNKLHGVTTVYDTAYRTGIYRTTNYKDGLCDGVTIEYLPSGAIAEETNYKDGEQHGARRSYYTNGQLYYEKNYKDGNRDGVSKEYYENGQLKKEENYTDGNLEGTVKTYYMDGQLEVEMDYKNDRRNGNYKKYYQNGQLAEESTLENDNVVISKKYYENGQLSSLDDRDGGIKKEYYENGQLREDYRLKGGKIVGLRKRYYPSGNLKYQEKYEDGVSVSVEYYYESGQKITDRIVGQANLEEMTILIDKIEQSADTLPHEYAHHYVGWFRDTPLVKEAIRKYGSEEKLVQAIGEEVVKRNGEARTWFKQFTAWVKSFFRDLTSTEKEEILDTLTDAFLTAKDLETKKTGISAERSRQLADRASGISPSETLFQNEGGTVRGAVVFEDSKATIYAMTDPTVATPLHELAHVYEKYLTEQERNEVMQAAGKDTWDRSVSEYFARGFEEFLADGIPPSTKLMTAFRKFRVWMSSVFNAFDQPETELNEEMRRIYSIMLGETPMSDVPASEISAEVSDTEQLKTELATTIESMRKAGNTDSEIYQGLIKDGTFSAADLSDYFDLNTKQTVYDQVQSQGKFAQEAQEILEDSQHVIRSLAELNKEMANLDELEARGILYALNGLPNVDVAVAKIITQMLDNKAKGISSVEDLMLIAKTGTNVGRALQRFKMLKKQQPRLVVASLVKDLKAVGAQIPPRALKELDDSARRFMDAIEKLDNAKAANQDARYVNGTSPFDQNKSNHEYYLDSLKEWQESKLDYSKKMQTWARKSVNLGAGKAFSEWYKTSVRLNLLTVRSLGRNFSSNLVKGALNLSVNKIATTVSLLRGIKKEQVTFKGLKYNLATLKGVKPGLKQTAEVLRFGNISDIGSKVEINGGFNGFRALVEWVGAGFAKMSGASDIEIAERFNFVLDKDGKIKNGDKFLRFAEGSLGLFSETISRAMQAGDLIFKNTAYYGAMHQEARRRGLKTPKEIKHFMDLHMDYSDNNSFEDALTYVYANDSKAYKAVSRMFSGGGSDFYSSLWTTLVPYQKIPTNVFAEYFEFMTPMYGILSSGLKFNDAARLRRESNRQNNPTKKLLLKEQSDRANQRAEQSIGRAMTGFGLYMIAFELVKLGVLSAKSATRKEAEEKDEMGGSNRLNITLLLEELGIIESKGRTMKEPLDGDLTVELEFLGAFGAILALSQAKFENIKKDIYNKPLNVESTKVNEELEPNMNVLEILDPTEASNYFGPLGYNLNLSFVKNLASATEAIISLGESDSEDPGKIAKFIVDLSMTSVSSVLPNIMTDMTKTMQGEEGVKFDYNLKDMSGGKKILRDFGSRLNERLFRSFSEILDPAIDRDVFNQPKKLTPKGRDPIAYQMFDLTRGDLEKGLSQTYVNFRNNRGKRPSWQDLVAFARLFNAPESVFPSLVKPIRETEKGAIKLKPTLDEIKEHKAMVLKVREELANSVLDEMQSSGNLQTFFDMSAEMNTIKERQVPKGILVFSNVMSSIYSRSESLVNKFMVPLIEINYINNLKIENPKAYAKYQKLMEDNIYSAYYDEITKDKDYKEALEELKRDIVQKVQDAIDNPTTFKPEMIE